MAEELRTAFDAASAIASTDRLLLLDDVWTTYLDHADPPESVANELPMLELLVDDMAGNLDSLVGPFGGTASILRDQRDEAVMSAAERLIADVPESRRAEVDLGTDFAPAGLRSALITSCAYVERYAGEEITALRDKLTGIQEGRFERGDLGSRIRCALELGRMGLAVGPCVLVFPAGCFATGAAVIQWILSWKDSGCRKLLEPMIDRLRAQGVEV